MWIDSGNCNFTFHVIKKLDGEWMVIHADDTECDVTEFDISDLVEDAGLSLSTY